MPVGFESLAESLEEKRASQQLSKTEAQVSTKVNVCFRIYSLEQKMFTMVMISREMETFKNSKFLIPFYHHEIPLKFPGFYFKSIA